MFQAEDNVRNIASMQEQAQAELLQKINDILIAGGYFRARLNIDPFDKVIKTYLIFTHQILGGMCWSIAGSNFDIDIEFSDDLIMGQKIKLSEKVVAALKQMDCPLTISPVQIQGLDYARIFPVIQWLVKKLMESRDTRGERNKKQAILNYNLKFQSQQEEEIGQNSKHKESDIQKIKEIVFRGKPKRVFRSNRTKDVAFHDPKRVHTALREFNDMSANKVFQAIIEQIAQFENEEKAKLQQFHRQSTKGSAGQAQQQTAPGQASGQQPGSSGQSYDLQQQTQEEIIANVEKMLMNEKASVKALPKASAAQEFDLNEGIVSVSQKPKDKLKQQREEAKQAVAQQQKGGSQPAGQHGQPGAHGVPGQPQKQGGQFEQVQEGQQISPRKSTVRQGGASDQMTSGSTEGGYGGSGASGVEDEGEQILDQDIAIIKRKTLIVKTDNVSEAFMSNIDQIAETVQGFQKMSEESFQNDAVFYFQSEKENYERQIQKLQGRIEKSHVQRHELQKMAQVVTQEVEQLEYEREQYVQQANVFNKEIEDVDYQIEQSSVKEHEIMVVTALIDEKARLNEDKIALKKNCRDEKIKLEQELEKMKKRREDMEREEHAEVLRQIDGEFDFEHNKLLEQRKQIAEVNRNITVIQRRIENCPSKIEITQFHKRLVELFDNLNLKSEENRRYVNLFNTVMETKRMFKQQSDYLKEISDSYRGCKQKKEKEVLLHNIKNVLEILDKSIGQSTDSLGKLKLDYQRVQASFNESILREKDHFKRIKEYEDECDKNDELRSKAKK